MFIFDLYNKFTKPTSFSCDRYGFTNTKLGLSIEKAKKKKLGTSYQMFKVC